MKHLARLCFLTLLIGSFILGEEKPESVYSKELHAFKENPQYKAIFDENVSVFVPQIYRDIHNYKQLSYWQRFARFFFFNEDVVIVTSDTMPQLFAHVQSVCDKQNMPIPTIFITREKGVFNAFAAKIFETTGGILLCQKMIEDTSNSELEAVIAHELGHIKHNHANKTLARYLPLYIAVLFGMSYTRKNTPVFISKFRIDFLELLMRHVFADVLADMIAQLTIGKKFEKEADEFAYKDVGNGQGLIEFFKHVQDKEKAEDDAFNEVYTALEKNKSQLSADDHQQILINYYVAKGFQGLIKGFKWVYYNTRFGPHPSPEERQKTIEEYLTKNGDN